MINLSNFFRCRPYLTVDGILFGYHKKDFYILLVQRNREPYKGYYVFPGGFVECKETVEESIKREVKEETGININFEKNDQFRVYSHPMRDPRHHTITVVFYKEISIKEMEKALSRKNKIIDKKEIRDIKIIKYKDKNFVLGFDHEFILRDFIKWYNERNK